MLLTCLLAMALFVQTRVHAASPVQHPHDTLLDDRLAQNDNGLSFAERDRILSELHDTMSNLTSLMDKHALMTQAQLQTTAEVVKRISIYLRVLSQPMASNNAANTIATIREHNSQLNDTIDELQAQLNDN